MSSTSHRVLPPGSTSSRRAIAFVALFCAATVGWTSICDHEARRDVSQKASWTFKHSGESYDFLVLGSSRANSTTDVRLLEARLDAKGLNIGEDGASYLESEALFKHFSANNRVCSLLLEVDSFGLSGKMEEGKNLWKYTPFLGDPAVDEYVHRVAPQKFYLWKWIPYAKYAEFNGQVGWRSVYRRLRQSPGSYDERGSSLLDGDYVEPLSNRTRIIISDFDSALSKSLSRIVGLAPARHMPVVLYTAPELAASLPFRRNRTDVMNFYSEFARARGIPFLSFDSLPMSSDSTKFRDSEHPNRAGAEIFSAALADELKRRHALMRCS